MARRYFGTDGIRGLANSPPMTSEIALKVGMAAGKLFSNGQHRHRVVIGKDTRLSGYMIESALMSGFTAVGMDVFLLGPMPTPAVAMLTRSLRADLGVMISASHNPYEDNGIKLFDPDGYKLSDEAEGQIEALMAAPTDQLLAPADRIGRAKRIESAQERYIEYAKRTLPRNIRLNDLRVVVDCANGAGYQVAPDALWELGAEVIKIGVEPNGHNINLKCGSTSPEALCDKVREMRADIGVALDGDADRVVIVDEKGRIVDGDQIMAVIAESWHRRGKLTAGGVVATVMSNLGLERYLKEIGLSMVRTPVGDRYVVRAHAQARLQRRRRAVGPHRAVRLHHHRRRAGLGAAGALRRRRHRQAGERGVQALRAGCRRSCRTCPTSTARRWSRTSSSRPSTRARRGSGGSGRLVIRPSGTEPVIRVMAEGDDERLVHQVVGDIAEAVRKAAQAA